MIVVAALSGAAGGRLAAWLRSGLRCSDVAYAPFASLCVLLVTVFSYRSIDSSDILLNKTCSYSELLVHRAS